MNQDIFLSIHLPEFSFILPFAFALLGIFYGAYLARKIFKLSPGNEKMQKISQAIQEGADAYLKRQFKTIVVFAAVLFFGLLFFLGAPVAVAFIFGALASALAGYISMYVAVRTNSRAAQASLVSMQDALSVPFSGGVVSGAMIAGIGLLGVSAIFFGAFFLLGANSAALSEAAKALIGFGFGANLLALFMRVGGGIYTKAADVGADLVGKVEKGIPEDDPRNPATIADNVGDNVGDCAGMGADVFESYTVTIIAAMVLGATLAGLNGAIFPLLVAGGAFLLGLLSTFVVKIQREDEHPFEPMKRGFLLSLFLQAAYFLAISLWFADLRVFFALLLGLVVTQLIIAITDYYTSTKNKPVQTIAVAAQSGAGTNLISGLGVGMESAVIGIVVVALAVFAGFYGTYLGYLGIALVGLGMLSTTAFIMAMDTFGPIADNAGGIGEMSGIHPSGKKRMGRLDAVGNTTKAVTKGFAISSAAVAAVALFATFFETTGLTKIDIAIPAVFAGFLIGGAIPFIFSSLTMKAVGEAANLVVSEVRRQFKDPAIMKGTKKPDYAACVDISTKAAINSLMLPAAIVVLAPIAVGAGPLLFGAPPSFGLEALGGFIAGAILVSQLMAIFMANAGAAWDNAKKFIEDGNLGGKGSEAHKAAVVGDTVGDPFKDTSGPALNPMIKILNIVSLMVAAVLAGKQIGAI
ncbi:MAG: sodium-translocating pyrophosphatase [Candidatus Micrarchaeota archaeon]|nr:sodium-translocating pyrophosphatase [Candidatus Micrarchaeota archaeon]